MFSRKNAFGDYLKYMKRLASPRFNQIGFEPGTGENPTTIYLRSYIVGIMSKDWGFYYTFTTNIQKVVDFIPEFPSLAREQADIIRGRVHEIVREIESAPKSLKWKVRAKIGTRQRWYQEVSDKGEVY